MMDPDVSIVMQVHNRRENLRVTLNGLCQQTYPAERFEVAVVDQASTDGCRDLVRSMATPFRLRLVEQDGKYGFPVARNGGIAASRGQLIILLDADLPPDSGLVAAHVEFHATYRRSLGSGRVLPYGPANTSFIDRTICPELALDRGDTDRVLPFWDVLGGHLSFTRKVFQEIGPFDTSLSAFDEVDFAYRAERLGIGIRNCPAAIAYHNHSRTLQQRCEQARAYDRNVPVLLARYPELRGKLPFACDFEAINWRRDGAQRLYRKLRIRLLATSAVQRSFFQLLSLLDRTQRAPRLAKILYWRLIAGSHYLGFRDGCMAGRELTPTGGI